MRALKTALVAAVAIVSLAVGASSAQANPWPHPHFGHGHFWGPAAVLGIVGAAAYAGSCLRSQPMYDAYGNYLGDRTVNVCY